MKAIELAAPHSSAVVTLPPSKTPTGDRERLRSFARIIGAVARDLRSDGAEWEWVWTLEHSATGLANAHVLQRGDRVSSLRFRRALAKAGGRGDIQPIRHVKILSRYILKLPLAGLDLPNVDPAAAMELHIRINGGRVVHASRRFFVDAQGGPLTGVRAAREVARRTVTKGSAPSQEQLEGWRAGWDIPDVAWDQQGRRVVTRGPETDTAEGGGTGAGAPEPP